VSESLEVLTQARVLAELLVGGEPPELQTRLDAPLDHRDDLCGAGEEVQVGRDRRLVAAGSVTEPGLLRPVNDSNSVVQSCRSEQDTDSSSITGPSSSQHRVQARSSRWSARFQ